MTHRVRWFAPGRPVNGTVFIREEDPMTAERHHRRRKVERLNHADAAMVANAANELAVAYLDGDPEFPDQLRALIEVLREVGLADS